jgi:hypothetical protein
MRMRTIPVVAAVAAMLLAVSACGPVYHTKREYIAPRDPVSRTCVASCAQTREACIHNNELKYESCRRDAERDYDVCAERAVRKNKKPDKECSRGYCSKASDEQACEPKYAQCYRDCGGTVTEERVCTAMCDGK